MTHQTLNIDGRPVGPGRPTFVIAEVGVNHDGDVRRACDLVRVARAAGADAVKLQLFSAGRLVHATATAAGYQQTNCGATDQASLLRKYELSPDDVERVVDAARVAGIVPLATPFSPSDVDLIERLDLPAIKIASPDVVNLPLLRRAAESGKPMLVSTGAANPGEIARCAKWLRKRRVPFGLMHCVSAYPTPAKQCHLGWIAGLADRFDCPVGYSDHSTEPLAGALAVAAGACVVEKHLTHDRFAVGPDHAASADPHGFRMYVDAIRLADQMCGGRGGQRRVLPVEADVRKLSRQSVVLARPVRAGQVLTADDLTAQRPGTGIPAAEFDAVVGRRPITTLPAGTLLEWSMLAAEVETRAA